MPLEHSLLIKNYGCVFVPSPSGGHPTQRYAHWRSDPPDVLDQVEMVSTHDGDLHLMCGTGNVYAIDVDAKNGLNTATTFMSGIKSWIESFFVEKTKSGGYHIFFRYEGELQSTNLCFVHQDSGKYNPVVELMGNTSLCRFQSNGAVPVSGDPDHIGTMTDELLGRIMGLAEALDEKPQKEEVKYEPRERIIGLTTPGDDYSTNVNVDEIISEFEASGWHVVKKTRGRVLLRRPDAKSKNHDADILVPIRVFKCYSSSVSEFETGKGYSFFAAYTILRHGGDYTASARALGKAGWGTQAGYNPQAARHIDPVTEIEPVTVSKYEVRLSTPPPKRSWAIKFMVREGTSTVKYNVGVAGSLGFVSGPKKSRKTATLTAIATSALTGKPQAGWDVRCDGDVIWIDTEQPDIWAYQTLRRVCIMGDFKEHPERLHVYALRGVGSKQKRMDIILEIIAMFPNARLVIIDGIVDVINDFNDNKESGAVIDQLMAITTSKDEPVTVITVIHLNPGSTKERGSAGTIIGNKCDWSAQVVLDDSGISTLTFPNLRGSEGIPAQEFRGGRYNIPYLVGYPVPQYDYSIGFDIDMDEDDEPVEQINQPKNDRPSDREVADLPF